MKWCTTKDEYRNVNHNTRVTSIAGVTSFADYALPSQVLQPRLPVQSGGPAEAGAHQGRDDRFLSFFSKYIFRSLVALCGFFGWLDKILISTFVPMHLFHHHHHHQLLLHHKQHHHNHFLSTGNSALYLREGGGRKNPPKPSSQEDLCHVRLPHAASGFLFFITTLQVSFVVRAF